MTQYVLIESRDPYDSNDVGRFLQFARDLLTHGNSVTLFLVQNGVLPARQTSQFSALTELAEDGVEILADAFSLSERGIDPGSLIAGVRAAPLDTVVDNLAGGCKAIWH